MNCFITKGGNILESVPDGLSTHDLYKDGCLSVITIQGNLDVWGKDISYLQYITLQNYCLQNKCSLLLWLWGTEKCALLSVTELTFINTFKQLKEKLQ